MSAWCCSTLSLLGNSLQLLPCLFSILALGVKELVAWDGSVEKDKVFYHFNCEVAGVMLNDVCESDVMYNGHFVRGFNWADLSNFRFFWCKGNRKYLQTFKKQNSCKKIFLKGFRDRTFSWFTSLLLGKRSKPDPPPCRYMFVFKSLAILQTLRLWSRKTNLFSSYLSKTLMDLDPAALNLQWESRCTCLVGTYSGKSLFQDVEEEDPAIVFYSRWGWFCEASQS